MSVDSRAKGARVERDIAHILEGLTGVKFLRNLEQSRSADQGDLIPDDPAWPFSIEIKARAAGISCLAAWKAQSARSAEACGKLPAVVFKFDRQPIRVAVQFKALAQACGATFGDADEWAEITLPGLAYLAAEMMAAERECRA